MAINTSRVGGTPSEGPRPEKKAHTTPSSEVAKKTLSGSSASPPQGGVRGLAKFWEQQASSNKPTAPAPRKLPPTPPKPSPALNSAGKGAEPTHREEVKSGPKPLSSEDREKLLQARASINSLRSKMSEVKQEQTKPAAEPKAPTESPSRSKAELFKEKSQAFHARAQQAKSQLQDIKARHEDLKGMQERTRPLPPTPSSVPKAPAAPPLEQEAMEPAPAMPKKSAQGAPERGNLLADIHKGVQLKSSADRPIAPVKSDAGDLRSHLASRRQHIEEDDEDDESISSLPSSSKVSQQAAPSKPQPAQVKSSSLSSADVPPPPPPAPHGAAKSASAPKGKDFLSEIRGKGVADLKKTDQPEQKKASKAQDGTASFNKSMLEKAAELEKQAKTDLPESSDDEWGD